MKQMVLPQKENYPNTGQRKRRRKRIVTCLAAVVVFCTSYALILPAITMEKQPCDVPEHVHTDACYAQVTTVPEEVLVCDENTEPAENTEAAEGAELADGSAAVHEHTAACWQTVLTPADTETLTCTLKESAEHTHGPRCYGTWKRVCGMQEHVHTEACQPLASEDGLPVLSGDDAYVSNLQIGEATVYGAADERPAYAAANGDLIGFPFTAEITSYTEQSYSKGRVKLEFVLPLSSEQAVFDTGSMPWLKGIDGGPAAVSIEEREVNGENVACQVLTGYQTLLSEADGQAAISGSFSQTAIVRVLQMEPGELVSLTISAAAEYSTWDGLCTAHEQAEKRTAESKNCVITDPDAEAEEENPETMAEAAYGDNWKILRDSGWFEEYAAYGEADTEALAAEVLQANDTNPSGVQVVDEGGTESNEEDGVSVSKTIAGTELENVFDITLKVQTTRKIEEIIQEPDMAVVIVMDISNTMNEKFGNTTRYKAAIEAAESFLDKFAENNTLGISKIGYVAFNTDAHEIFGLQSCTNASQAGTLKNTMRTQTGKIINAEKYGESHSRYTNIEAGLKMGQDMLGKVSNKNKFIIFLSDGFPTTYIKSGYEGYDPYDSTGRFYDHVLRKKCLYGNSYSDEAAIRARKMAVSIQKSGTQIFSIGVDVGGQTIQQYITQSEKANGFSVVDRTSTNYEIGDATSTEAYKNWLRNSIGSGYYYDSTNTAGLKAAYDEIFKTIKQTVEAGSKADWVANDPIPTVEGVEDVEFIGFFDKKNKLYPLGEAKTISLTGNSEADGENTADFTTDGYKIAWDLKNSGYSMEVSGNTTTYTYQITYRVRLENEKTGFVEGQSYKTNDTTTLRYRVVKSENGNLTVSDPKTINFPIPSVRGYLGELKFQKTDMSGHALAGAEFTLQHAATCKVCRGDGGSVSVASQTVASGADGLVAFDKIPSGHTYLLTETKVPDGYVTDGYTYEVKVAYDKVTVYKKDAANNIVATWDSLDESGIYGTIQNRTFYELPSTGGPGTQGYTTVGLLLMISAATLLLYQYKKRRKEETESS